MHVQADVFRASLLAKQIVKTFTCAALKWADRNWNSVDLMPPIEFVGEATTWNVQLVSFAAQLHLFGQQY